MDRLRTSVVGVAVGAMLAACSSAGDGSDPGTRPGSADASTGAPDAPGNGGAPDAGTVPDAGFEDAACAPACEGRACGPDSCGGECGTCGERELCDETSGACMPQLCPPEGPFGTNVGDVFPNLTFSDCDGNTHELHDLCEAKASYFFIYAGW